MLLTCWRLAKQHWINEFLFFVQDKCNMMEKIYRDADVDQSILTARRLP